MASNRTRNNGGRRASAAAEPGAAGSAPSPATAQRQQQQPALLLMAAVASDPERMQREFKVAACPLQEAHEWCARTCGFRMGVGIGRGGRLQDRRDGLLSIVLACAVP